MFDEKEGIFANPVDSNTISVITNDFVTESTRLKSTKGLSLPPETEAISIQGFRKRIHALEAAHQDMTHISLFYGLDAMKNFTLVLGGVAHQGASFRHFSETSPSTKMGSFCSNPSESAIQCSHFRNEFNVIYGVNEYARGTFMRIKQANYAQGNNTIHKVLDAFEQDGCDLFTISFGFMEPDKSERVAKPEETGGKGLICYHMIFKGKKSKQPSFTSRHLFSTYDNEKGYSGPKPVCPPHACN